MQKLAGVAELFRNPLLEKDLRTTGRSLKFFLFLMTFIVIASIVVLVIVQNMYGSSRSSGLQVYGGIFLVQSLSIALVIPAYACTTIANERQRRTYNLLIISSLKPWEIAWGKFLAIMVYIFVFIAAFLPLIGICFLYGGVPPALVFYSYLNMLLSAAVTTAFCLMLSAASSNPIVTVIVGYIFMFIFSGFFINVINLLLMRRMGPGMVMGGAPAMFGFQTLILLLTAAFSWSLFYLATVAILKPSSWNKSTPLRIWFFAFVVACIGVLSYVTGFTPAQSNTEDLIIYSFIFAVFPSLFAAIGFAAEPHRLPNRLQQKIQRVFGPLKLFAPGGGTGVLFTVFTYVMHMTFVILLSTAVASPGWRTDLDDLYLFTACAGLFVLFVAGVSYLARTLWNSARSRIITIATIAAVCLLPMLVLLQGRSPIIWLSPLLGYMDLIGHEFGMSDSGPALYFGFYSLATIIIFAVAVSCSVRNRKRLDVKHYADSKI